MASIRTKANMFVNDQQDLRTDSDLNSDTFFEKTND